MSRTEPTAIVGAVGRPRKWLAVPALLSAVVGTFAGALWVRSYGGGESWTHDEPVRRISVNSEGGRLSFEVKDHYAGVQDEASAEPGRERRSPWFEVPEGRRGWRHVRPGYAAWAGGGGWWNWFGFDRGTETQSRSGPGLTLIADVRLRWVTVPYWSIGCILVPVPALWLVLTIRRVRRLRRFRGGRCIRCGYDLRASSDRCPECGQMTWQKARATGPTLET